MALTMGTNGDYIMCGIRKMATKEDKTERGDRKLFYPEMQML